MNKHMNITQELYMIYMDLRTMVSHHQLSVYYVKVLTSKVGTDHVE